MSDLANKITSQIPIKEPAWLKEFKPSSCAAMSSTRRRRGDRRCFTAIVTSVVEDLINPIVGILMGGIDFSNLFVVLFGERRASPRPRARAAPRHRHRSFLNAVIKFLIVSFASSGWSRSCPSCRPARASTRHRRRRPPPRSCSPRSATS